MLAVAGQDFFASFSTKGSVQKHKVGDAHKLVQDVEGPLESRASRFKSRKSLLKPIDIVFLSNEQSTSWFLGASFFGDLPFFR